MKLNLNKKKMKTLSIDNRVIPTLATPHIAGGFTPRITLRDCENKWTMENRHTCGKGNTCPNTL
jgi:hypothetical protein